MTQNPTLIPLFLLAGAIGFVAFSIFFFMGIKMLFSKSMGLIIDENGITLPYGGLLEWKNITDIKLEIVANTKFILVYINNSEQYLQRLGVLQRFFAKMNLHYCQTPISISSKSLKYRSDPLAELLQQKFKLYAKPPIS